MSDFNTNNMTKRQFSAHGRVEIKIFEEGIIEYLAVGPFNLELVEAVSELENEALTCFKEKFGKWCEVVVFEQSSLILEDALILLAEHIKETVENSIGPSASAYVFLPGIEGGNLMSKQYENCYKACGIPYQKFDNEADALDWAREQLARL